LSASGGTAPANGGFTGVPPRIPILGWLSCGRAVLPSSTCSRLRSSVPLWDARSAPAASGGIAASPEGRREDPPRLMPWAVWHSPRYSQGEGTQVDPWRTGVWPHVRPAGHTSVSLSSGRGVFNVPVPRVAYHSGARGSRRREPYWGDGGAVVCERRGAPMRIALVRSRAEERAAAAAGETQGRTWPLRHRQNKKKLHAVRKENHSASGGKPAPSRRVTRGARENSPRSGKKESSRPGGQEERTLHRVGTAKFLRASSPSNRPVPA
jgi:hypothetical protein